MKNKKEAKQIIREQLLKFRSKPYSELIQMLGKEPITYEIAGQSEIKYQIEIQVFWDDRPNGDIRVMGNIDDGGLRSFYPLTDDFVKNPMNNFVGE